jgi:hypothetical protein
LLPYRVAIIGLVASCLYIGAWLEQVGMEGKVIILVLPTMFIVYIGAAKVVADSGLVYMDPPAIAWDISRFALGGVNSLRAATRATSSLVSFNVNHPRGFALPLLVHINRLGDFVSGAGRRLFWGVFSAYLIGVVVSTLWTVWLSYRLGAHEFRGNFLILYEGVIRYNRAMDTMVNPKALEAIDYWLFLSGIGIMGLLNLMRYRFTWWPFHPVGFALMGTTFTRRESSTILVAWLVKFVSIKLFGAGFYQRTRPFFVGLLVGYVIIVIFGLVIDAIWFPMHGHIIHNWY